MRPPPPTPLPTPPLSFLPNVSFEMTNVNDGRGCDGDGGMENTNQFAVKMDSSYRLIMELDRVLSGLACGLITTRP